MAALCGDVFISKLRKFRLSFAVFQYSNPSFPYISQYPLQIFLTCELNSQECGSLSYYYLYLSFLFSRVSKVIRLLILAPLKKISWKESKFKTMKRRNASDDGERGNKQLREQAVCESSSSQESSSTPSVKDMGSWSSQWELKVKTRILSKVLEQLSIDCRKAKTKENPTTNRNIGLHNHSQWELKAAWSAGKLGKTRMIMSRLFLVLHWIDWQEGASCLDQSQSKVKNN